MKTLLPVLLFNLSFVVAQDSINLPSNAELESLIAENSIPALGIGTIENGQITNAYVIGNLKETVPAPDNAIFDTASITKSITTWLALRLVNEGLFDLDEPLHPYWIDPDVAKDPFHKLLTARHILGHQSGFKNWRYMNEDGLLAFDFEPGTKVQYSGEGFEYLKEALVRKLNMPFEKLVQKWVLAPFKMNDSHVIWNKAIDTSRLTLAHNQKMEPYPFDIEERKTASAADNFMTTVQDLAFFGKNILEKNGVSENVFHQMIDPKSVVREGVAFGLGWIVFENLADGEYALLNAGSDKGVNAIILLLPKSKRGLIALTNGDNGRKVVMQLIGKTLDVGPEILSRF